VLSVSKKRFSSTPENKITAERAKDVSSAAVFVALLNVALMWIILLFT
jgi:diacylglycerol kinase